MGYHPCQRLYDLVQSSIEMGVLWRTWSRLCTEQLSSKDVKYESPKLTLEIFIQSYTPLTIVTISRYCLETIPWVVDMVLIKEESCWDFVITGLYTHSAQNIFVARRIPCVRFV